MPSSFSRFLSEEEMRRVRDLYLKSLEESESDAEQRQAGEGQADAASSGSADDTRA